MMVRLVVDRKRTLLYECDHIAVTELEVGTTIELCGGKSSGAIIKLPENGNKVYVMNGSSKTVDCYQYPPKRRDDATGRLIEATG